MSLFFFISDAVIVNGFQVPPTWMFGTVYSGMTSTSLVSVSTDYMSLANIVQVLTVEVHLSIYKSDKSEDHSKPFDQPVLLLETPASKSKTQQFDLHWEEIYKDNYVRVCARLGKPTEDDPVYFYIENTSDYNVSVGYSDIAINDQMTNCWLTGVNIVSGARCVAEMDRSVFNMFDVTIPQNKDITSVTTKLSITVVREPGVLSSEDIYYSDRITID